MEMNNETMSGLVKLVPLKAALVLGMMVAVVPLPGTAAAAPPTRVASPRVDEAAVPERASELSSQDQEMLGFGTEFAREASQLFEKWIATGTISEEKLFSRLYYPVANTDPVKYATDYDAQADRDFPAVQEKYLSKSGAMLFAIITDSNGYVPTHNRQFTQPLTGNRAVDLVSNRTKRIFGDVTGFNSARNENRYLLQRYSRDTGEVALDLSVPIYVKGKHWGCVRLGYRQLSAK
jgi:methyl-accepting chemotaxis protein